MTTMEPGNPVALEPGEGEAVGSSVIKADRPELALFEFEIAPDGGAMLHLHKRHSDSFYVLEGELEFQVGEETVHATAGAYVLAPPGVPHSFRNRGTVPARALNLHTPGGFAQYWRELAELRAAGTEPDDAFFEQHDVYDVE
jgi:mannose-6-phosphate isomerase-like protein (cupin superfamily)